MQPEMARKSESSKKDQDRGQSDVELRKVTKTFGAFKSDAMGIDSSGIDEVQRHFLRGAWQDGTLKHYNSAVVKLIRFSVVKNVDRSLLLPISEDVLCQFVVWASMKGENLACDDESVKSSTLTAYLAGIKAWHIFHRCDYPHKSDTVVKKLLQASKRVEARFAEVQQKRPPVLVSDLVNLANSVSMKSEQQVVLATIALVAFWGTARLGELVSDDRRNDFRRGRMLSGVLKMPTPGLRFERRRRRLQGKSSTFIYRTKSHAFAQ